MEPHKKFAMATGGGLLVAAFCRANHLPVPAIRLKQGAPTVASCAYYRPHEGITVWPAACAAPGYAGRAWSWPGYVIDRTPFGVVAHEAGHHVDAVLTGLDQWGRGYASRVRPYSDAFVTIPEAPLTGYAPNGYERFAEMVRLFITNPDLLRQVRPATYAALRDRLRPVESRPWRQVLIDAPTRTVAMADKKILHAQGRLSYQRGGEPRAPGGSE